MIQQAARSEISVDLSSPEGAHCALIGTVSDLNEIVVEDLSPGNVARINRLIAQVTVQFNSLVVSMQNGGAALS